MSRLKTWHSHNYSWWVTLVLSCHILSHMFLSMKASVVLLPIIIILIVSLSCLRTYQTVCNGTLGWNQNNILTWMISKSKIWSGTHYNCCPDFFCLSNLLLLNHPYSHKYNCLHIFWEVPSSSLPYQFQEAVSTNISLKNSQISASSVLYTNNLALTIFVLMPYCILMVKNKKIK